MKKLLLIIFIIPLFAISQERGHGGKQGSFRGFGKDNSKDYFKGNIGGKVIDSKTGKPLEFASIFNCKSLNV